MDGKASILIYLKALTIEWMTLTTGGVLAVAFFIVGAISNSYFGWQTLMSIAVMLLALFGAAYKVWKKEYEKARQLISQLDDSSITFDKLDSIQQEIVLCIAEASEKRLAIVNTLQGTLYMGLESITEKYAKAKLESEIMDLVQKGLFNQGENFGKHNNRLYKPTKLFFELTDSISE